MSSLSLLSILYSFADQVFISPLAVHAIISPGVIPYDLLLACVASVSSRVIARNLEREPKKREGGGGGEKRKLLPANPTILENAP